MKNIPLVSFNEELKIMENKFYQIFKKQLKEGDFIGGSSVNIFEEKIQNYFSSKYAISVANGTDALVIALESIKLKYNINDGKIIVPSFSFFATSEAIVKSGFEPIFVDVERETGNIKIDSIDLNKVKKAVGILPVHLFGKPSNIEALNNFKIKNNLFMVEDVAQAFGSIYDERHLGTFGDAGCFSFFPTKILGGYGDGGMILTDDKNIADYSNILKNHGSRMKYDHEVFGYNSRLDSLQAGLLTEKLKHIDKFIKSRVEVGKLYIDLLKDNENIELMNYENSVFNYFTILVPKERNNLMKYLRKNNVSSAIYYPKILPMLKAHSNLGYKNTDFPNATYLSKTALSLPIWSLMDKKIVIKVANIINGFFK